MKTDSQKPKQPNIFRRIAKQFCDARVQRVMQEMEYHRHLIDAIHR